MNRSIPPLHVFSSADLTRKSPLSGFDSIAIAYSRESATQPKSLSKSSSTSRPSGKGKEKTLEAKLRLLGSTPHIRALEKLLSLDLNELLEIHTKELANKDGVVEAKAGEMVSFPVKTTNGSVREVIFFALGNESVVDSRKVGSLLGRRFKGKKKKVLIVTKPNAATIELFYESLLLSNYQWSAKSAANSDHPSFSILDGKESVLQRVQTIVSQVWNARDLIHTPSNIKTPAWVASRMATLAKGLPRVKVVSQSGAAISKFGGLLAVGGSSKVHPPRFVTVTYSPPKAKAHVVLVGKGITFDTGGVSLKRPYDMMMAMKTDMSGAAVVGTTVLAAAELKLPVKVTALLMLAENTLSATAQRPSDVITHYGGTTVEVINTDAEGRLVLADGLAYADLHLDPDYLIDVATLTGAASLGLGKQYGAMYSRDKKLATTLNKIGEVAGDRLWHMPLIDDYAIALKSEIADFNHTADKPKFGAGSVTAALFLEKFVGKRRWVHLDIAGPARSEVDAGEFVKGGTGFGVRTLTAWLATL